MKTIEIKKDVLQFIDTDDQELYTITNKAEIYYAVDQSGNEKAYTRSELSKLCGDLEKIDWTLEMLSNKEYGCIYTDDMINFINQSEFDHMPEEYKQSYEQIEFVV